MRELAVFYCPKCGHYAYYQTSRHPQCPKCGTQEAMYMVRMHYTEFMRMSCDERDEFLSREILKTNPSLITRLTEPHKRYNSREIIAEMNNVIMNLDTENKILERNIVITEVPYYETGNEANGITSYIAKEGNSK